LASELERDLESGFLRRALNLAEGGRGRVSPNPLVGAVVARDGQVLGEGHHAELGGVHAEVAALADCRSRGHDPAGSTMHVTLEPCAHHGRQPPCTDAILAARVARVVIGAEDPSAKASGRGPGILRDEGIEVLWAEGGEAAAARLQNQAFRKHARTGRPQVVLKSALSLDGYTATRSGDSRWISGAESRASVHRWRAEADAVAVGIGTVLADDPLLTARDVTMSDGAAPHQSLRVVFDSRARLPRDSQLVRTAGEGGVMLVVDAGEPAPDRLTALREAGIEPLSVAGDRGERIRAALDELGRRGITSLLLEGGAELAGAFLDAGEVDELRLFIAPIVLGAGRPLAARGGVAGVAGAERALAIDWQRSGPDALARARLREW
jgi:diaminohydroxyphosphoribosylaminopyrimidine deaminase/5-amino-6-(5-phosphoribosylamino)uracil reductase